VKINKYKSVPGISLWR